MKPISIKGKKFGRLYVVKYDISSKKTGHARWFCVCSCGKKKSVRASHLKIGNTKSCGCLVIEKSKSLKRRIKMSIIQRGENNSNWKPKSKNYGTIHSWLDTNFVKVRCTHCKNKDKKLDWALLKGKKYVRKWCNFVPLCRSCHIKYDYTKSRKKKVIEKVLSKRWKRLI